MSPRRSDRNGSVADPKYPAPVKSVRIDGAVEHFRQSSLDSSRYWSSGGGISSARACALFAASPRASGGALTASVLAPEASPVLGAAAQGADVSVALRATNDLQTGTVSTPKQYGALLGQRRNEGIDDRRRKSVRQIPA